MSIAPRLLLGSSLFVLAIGARLPAHADPSAPNPPPTVSNGCTSLAPKAKQECLKVAKQMEVEAAKPHDPSSTTPSSTGPSSETVHHSSPIMQTDEEKKASAKAAKQAEQRRNKSVNTPN